MLKSGQVLYNKFGDRVIVKNVYKEFAEGTVEHTPYYSTGYGGLTKGSIQYVSVQIRSHEIGSLFFYNKEDISNWELLFSKHGPYVKNIEYIRQNFNKELNDAKEYIPYGPSIDSLQKQRIINSYYNTKQQHQKEISFHQKHPDCFGRMDFDTELSLGHDTKYFKANYHDTVYISKNRYQQLGEIQIVNWRSEIASMYYDQNTLSRKSPRYIDVFSKNTGSSVSGIEYKYDLMLKRSFSNSPFSYRDMYINGASTSSPNNASNDKSKLFSQGSVDPFLLKLIEEKRLHNQLTDIIATIQANQNEIIRHDHKKNMVVQGCAGSGKTMILLHRISYLKYNNLLSNLNRGIIIVPSNQFNNFIHNLSEDLEIGQMPRMTMFQYYLNACISYQKRLDLDANIHSNELARQLHTLESLSFINTNLTTSSERFDNHFENNICEFYNRFMASFYSNLQETRIRSIASRLGIEIDFDTTNARKLNILYDLVTTRLKNEYSIKERQAKNKLKEAEDAHHKYSASVYVNQLCEVKNKLQAFCILPNNLSSYSYRQIYNLIEQLKKENIILTSAQENMRTLQQTMEQKQKKLLHFFSSAKSQQEHKLNKLTDTIDKLQKSKTEKIGSSSIHFVEACYDAVNISINHLLYLIDQRKDTVSSAIYDLCDEIKLFISTLQTSNVSIDDCIQRIEKILVTTIGNSNFEHNINNLKTAQELYSSVCALALTDEENVFLSIAHNALASRHKLVSSAFEAYTGKSIVSIKNGKELITLLILYNLHCGFLANNYEYFFVDEGQDYSEIEYKLLSQIQESSCTFEIYGDCFQRISRNRGLDNWNYLLRVFNSDYFEINENYRNTVEIAEHVNKNVINIFHSIGLHGNEVILHSPPDILSFTEEIRSQLKSSPEQNKVFIYKDSFLSQDTSYRYLYLLRDLFGEVEAYTVSEAKGLEFSTVYVIENDMFVNEKYVSFSRALKELHIIHFKTDCQF